MRKQLLWFLFIVLAVTSLNLQAKSKGFPGRDKYPDLPYIELTDLFNELDNVTVVDARSALEFETLRITGAMNIPVGGKTFEEQVIKLRESTDKPIVFYCNGRTCMKSFYAVKKAMEAGVKDVFAYDAGIFEWSVAHPDTAILLGQSPVNVKHLISKKNFKKRLLNPDNFSIKAMDMGKKSVVIDVRDKYQRAGIGFYPGKERWASLNNETKLGKYLARAKRLGQTIFIYDEVGKQVRWLQYVLEKKGIKKYYFMEKGAKAYYANLKNW